jgi:hypothetical protein
MTTPTTPITAKEEWRVIDGYDGKYEVSSLGRVRKGSHMMPMTTRIGYNHVSLYRSGGRRYGTDHRVHRLVALAFFGPHPDGKHYVDHINHIRNDNRIENLRWASPTDNNRAHAAFYGGKPGVRGEKNGSALLNETQARLVRRCSNMRITKGWMVMLCECWGVSRGCLNAVAGGRTWKHIGGAS